MIYKHELGVKYLIKMDTVFPSSEELAPVLKLLRPNNLSLSNNACCRVTFSKLALKSLDVKITSISIDILFDPTDLIQPWLELQSLNLEYMIFPKSTYISLLRLMHYNVKFMVVEWEGSEHVLRGNISRIFDMLLLLNVTYKKYNGVYEVCTNIRIYFKY